MLYCSKCDKRLTPDHKCGISRRFFFGLLAGAAAVSAFGPLATPDNVLRVGDLLQVDFSSADPVLGAGGVLVAAMSDGRQSFIYRPEPGTEGLFVSFMAPELCTIESVRAVAASTVRDLPFKVVRSGDLALGRT